MISERPSDRRSQTPHRAKAKAKAAGLAQALMDVIITCHLQDGRSIGSIKVDEKRKQFNAHCCQLGQPGSTQDHRTETMPECRMNRKASSKPLGFLVQWLRQADAFSSHDDHLTSNLLITLEERRVCRRWLQNQAETDPGILHLLRKEAEFLGLPWIGVATVVE